MPSSSTASSRLTERMWAAASRVGAASRWRCGERPAIRIDIGSRGVSCTSGQYGT